MKKVYDICKISYHYNNDIQNYELKKINQKNKSNDPKENGTDEFDTEDTKAVILNSEGYLEQKTNILKLMVLQLLKKMLNL